VARGNALVDPPTTVRLIESLTRSRPPSPSPPGLDDLTVRERDVLELIARGRSSAEIATELDLGEAAVETHVADVLTKLNSRDRLHAVVLAHEAGVLR